MFLNLISNSRSNPIENDLLDELLSYMITLLDGGNINVQKTIRNYFNYYSKSEILFAKFHGLFSETISEYHEKASKSSKPLILRTQLSTAQIKDSVEEKSNNFKSGILIKTLRLLQLFTEGHNLDLQNYIRHQKNSRNNYDMVTIVIDLLSVFTNETCKENYENIIKCLDTLTEFVQGPCPLNQQTIIDSKFLIIANSLLAEQGNSVINGKGKKEAYDNSFEEWKRQRLKYKVS